MNKKLFFGLAATFAVAIAAVCITLTFSNTSSEYSALQAANIEALTKDEGSKRCKYDELDSCVIPNGDVVKNMDECNWPCW